MSWNDEIKKTLGGCGEKVYIGHNTMFAHPKSVFLGDRVRIDPFTWITTGLRTGHSIQICSHVVISGGLRHTVELGDWTFIGYGSKLFCASEDYSGEYGPVNEFWGENKIYRGDIKLSSFSGIASDVMVMPGVIFPEGCLIGAKSFVYSSEFLEPWTVLYGNPLRKIKPRNKDNVERLAELWDRR